MRRSLVALALALLLVGGASAGPRAPLAPSPRFEVLGHLNPGGGYHADVWAHRGFAYLSSHRGGECRAAGVRVVDVRSPRRPRRVASFADGRSEPLAGESWTEKTIVRRVSTPSFSGDLAVTTFQACSRGALQGFGLYDVTNPASPERLAIVRTQPRGSHEIWLHARGDRVYVYTAIIYSELLSSPDYDPRTRTARTPGDPDFRIYDVTAPTQPREVGSWGAWRSLRVDPTRGLGAAGGAAAANFVHSVITNAAGTRAFLSYWDLGTVILDIRDPTRPRYLGRTRFASGSVGNAHSAWLGRRERLLIQTHETQNGRPVLYDVSRPTRPVRLAEVRLPSSVLAAGRRQPAAARHDAFSLRDSVHDPKIRGNRAFFSWYGQGVVLADIANPRKPRFLARFLPRATPDHGEMLCEGHSCRSVWGVYVDGDVVYASDMLSGLWVLRLR